MASTTSISFKVTRRAPELIAPAKPTPREYKLLSDIDDQKGLRFHIPSIQFYRKETSLGSAKDPVEVIREAIAKTLVFYYPFAGRLKEGPGRKLGVDCTGEGVIFIEADADVRIEDFGEDIFPPFPCLEELIFDVPGSREIINCPLMLIQVTRTKCGGFIFANRMNHTMCDAFGHVQFQKAIAEIARGESSLSVPPIWRRELLSVREPTHLSGTHPIWRWALLSVSDPTHQTLEEARNTNTPLDDKIYRSFFLGPTKIAAIRSLFPFQQGRKPSTFEILAAWLWRCLTIALKPDSEEDVGIMFFVNIRGKSQSSPLPAGYYGNAFTRATAISPVGKLCQNPLGYALELVMKAMDEVTREHMRSLEDFLISDFRRPPLVRTFYLSDLTQAGFGDVDFGWGKPAYGGPVDCFLGASFLIPVTNAKGERGILVPIHLPGPTMERFELELETLLKSGQSKPGFSTSFIKPAL